MKKSNPVVVKINDTTITKSHQLHVYVTGPDGSIVESAAINENQVTLKKTKDELQGQHRIYIAPQVPIELSQKANEKLLIKAGAYQVVQNFKDDLITVVKLPISVLAPWLFNNCLIAGTITNTIIVDGNEVTLPVCNARVHLIEVEFEWRYPYLPVILKPIPNWVLADIGNKFREIYPAITHIDPSGPIELRSKTTRSLAMLNAGDDAKLKALPPLPTKVLHGITSTSIETVKQTIVDNHHLLYPYFCYWPFYWYWIYDMSEDNIVYTDCNGRFECWENTLTEDSALNIYTWVEVEINGIWTTVYRPFGVPCHTLWNYNCGTPININLHNPKILPCVCNVLEGDIVWVKRIGTGTSVRNISLNTADVGKPSSFPDARGLTMRSDVISNNWVCPFTNSFPIVVQFGDGFPSSNIKYFRWKYRQISDADLNPLNPVYTYQKGALDKGYTYQGLDINGNAVFYTGVKGLDISLGGSTAYKIPHVHASVDTGIASAEWDQDTTTIYVNAKTDLLNGVYEFVLELLDVAGNVANVGANIFQIDSFLPSPPNPASTPAIGVDGGYVIPNGGSVNGFRFLMRVDNDQTTCEIYNAMIRNGDGTTTTSDTSCGFAEYKDKATGSALLRFHARQPHRYADFSFSVIRGNGNIIAPAEANGEVPEPHINVWTSGGIVDCQVNPSINDMLGGCTRGAFAESLYVRAYHTDGSNRIDSYDSYKWAAFATTPVELGS